MIRTIGELIAEAHALAVEKGWWHNVELYPHRDTIAEKLVLIHCEISEAMECYRDGAVETGQTWGSKKPEGFWVEIADAVIRAADLAGWVMSWEPRYKGPILVEGYPWFHGPSLPTGLRYLHNSVEHGGQGFPEHDALISRCFAFANAHGVDLWEVINLKHAYNKTRPYRHGGKRA